MYLDNASTTKPYGEVIDKMVDVMQNYWGNPSAPYTLGDKARQLIEEVRELIAMDINADPDEIIFTSGACEANSLAIDGFLHVSPFGNCLTSKVEHASINDNGIVCTYLKNDNYGFVTMEDVSNIQDDLVSVAAANSEVGTIQDLKALSDATHQLGGIFHTDATQLLPERRIDVKALGIDMMSASAQKFHGPRGAGFLYVKKEIELAPIIHGSQENGLRGGTYNTAAIAGMGEALKITRRLQNIERDQHIKYVEELRNVMLERLMKISDVALNGAPTGPNRLKNNISLTIDGVNAEKLVTLCDLQGIYIGKGSACKSYDPTPSHVLKAIGLTDAQALNTVRITVSGEYTKEQINSAANIITKLVERMRNDE